MLDLISRMLHSVLVPQYKKDVDKLKSLPDGHHDYQGIHLKESPFLEILKSHPDMVLGKLLCLSRGLDQMASRGAFQPKPLCDSENCILFLCILSINTLQNVKLFV